MFSKNQQVKVPLSGNNHKKGDSVEIVDNAGLVVAVGKIIAILSAAGGVTIALVKILAGG